MPETSNLNDEYQRALALYDEGLITGAERSNSVARLALEPQFASLLPRLLPEILAELRGRAEQAPAHPEDIVLFTIGHDLTDPGPTERKRRDSELRLEQFWIGVRLRELLLDSRPLPPFREVVTAGTVQTARFLLPHEHAFGDGVDNAVALFGRFDDHLFRDNPVILSRPDATSLRTSVVGVVFVEDGTFMGRPVPLLDATVKDPRDVPTGTEVLVDRSAKRDIPPLPPWAEGG